MDQELDRSLMQFWNLLISLYLFWGFVFMSYYFFVFYSDH